MSTTQELRSAAVPGRLWGARARDWANIQEGRSRTDYEVVFERLGLSTGVAYCDVGCGEGSAVLIASQRGARVSGLDAAENLIEIPRERVPSGDFRVGEMEELQVLSPGRTQSTVQPSWAGGRHCSLSAASLFVDATRI
jgi:2-polyprenyl-3-methyl-5-hydroxy-6-metoxy-1,4-benzoquinol methylase